MVKEWDQCYHWHRYQDSKVHGANMGPPGSCWPQMGPMLVPWTLVSDKLCIDKSNEQSIHPQESCFGLYGDNGSKHTHLQTLKWVHNQFVMTVYMIYFLAWHNKHIHTCCLNKWSSHTDSLSHLLCLYSGNEVPDDCAMQYYISQLLCSHMKSDI